MNSGSEKKLSMDELKQLNRQPAAPPPRIQHPTEEEWIVLSRQIDALIRCAAEQTAAVSALSEKLGSLTIQRKLEAMARDLAAVREMLRPDGRRREPRFSWPEIGSIREHLAWLLLIPIIGVFVVALWSFRTLWNEFSQMLP